MRKESNFGKKILGAVFLVIAVACVVSAARQGGKNALLGGAVVGAVFSIFGVRNIKAGSSKQPAQKPAPAAAKPVTPAPQYHFVNFRVAGVTYNNDDGTNRQNIISDIEHQRPPFQDADNLNVSILKSSWQGELAYEVRVNGILIGHAPKNQIEEVSAALSHSDAEVSGFSIDGGTNGYKYGVGIAIRYK